jgi:magnesium-transporting ATPase (P-type)
MELRMSVANNAHATSAAAVWHAMSADEVVKRLATTSEKGLDAAEASTRLQKYGANRLPERKKQSPTVRFLAQFNNILVYVLLGAGFIKLMLAPLRR